MSETVQTPRARGFGMGPMIAIAIAAFGFSFALVPLYRIACEKVFGIRLERAPDDDRATEAGRRGRSDRLITVTFDGGVNSKLPWQFAPNRRTMQVRPGELYETTYHARNTSDRAPGRSTGWRCPRSRDRWCCGHGMWFRRARRDAPASCAGSGRTATGAWN